MSSIVNGFRGDLVIILKCYSLFSLGHEGVRQSATRAWRINARANAR
jgi:hypothetical protein